MTVFSKAKARGRNSEVDASLFATWRITLGLLGIVILIFALGFHQEGSAAIGVWLASAAYNHCFLVLPVVLYLLWNRRSIVEASIPRPTVWPLLLMPLLSAGWLLTAVLDINEGRQLLVVAMFEVSLLTALGWPLYRSLLAPLLFLFFLVPFGEFLVPSLQTITADVAVSGLRLCGVPVFADNHLIDIPEGRFNIAEACAGLRFLIAATVFSFFFAIVMYRSWLRRLGYIALSINVAIAANGIRAFGIIYLAHLTGSATAVIADHIIYGFVFLSIVILLLIAVGLPFVENTKPSPTVEIQSVSPHSPNWIAAAVPLSAVLALTGPTYVAWHDASYAMKPLPKINAPQVAASWQDHSVDGSRSWRPRTEGANQEALDTYYRPGFAQVTRYVGLYRLHLTGNRLTSSENRVIDGDDWHVIGQQVTQIDVEGKTVSVNETEIRSGTYRGLVWSFYVVNDRVTGSLFEAKLLQLRSLLRQRNATGAFVAIETEARNPGEAHDTLESFFLASQPLLTHSK